MFSRHERLVPTPSPQEDGPSLSLPWHVHYQPIQPWPTVKRMFETPWVHLRDRQKVTMLTDSDSEARQLEAAIAKSRWILDLKNNFDGRGSPGYRAIVWEVAVRFLRLQWSEYLRQFGEAMPLPEIQPGPSGTIDVFWETPGFELLVNIPTDSAKYAEFSGDNRGKGKIEGTLDPAQPNRGLVSWLASR